MVEDCTKHMNLTRLGKIVLWGSLWGLAVLIFSVAMDPTPENFTLAVSILLSGLYTWLLFLTRDLWIQNLARKPVQNAIILGSLNAAVIEILFLVVEKAFGATGVAAHPNLLIDLLITMPWYISMVWIFVRIQRRERFPLPVVLLLGAVYELGADGIVGGYLMPTLTGSPVNTIEFLALLALVAFWQFIPIYSSLVLPAAWVLDHADPAAGPEKKGWLRAFFPLLLLIPFTVYLIVLMTALEYIGI